MCFVRKNVEENEGEKTDFANMNINEKGQDITNGLKSELVALTIISLVFSRDNNKPTVVDA